MVESKTNLSKHTFALDGPFDLVTRTGLRFAPVESGVLTDVLQVCKDAF